MYVHTHTRIHTYIHRFIYIHVCVCECFFAIKIWKKYLLKHKQNAKRNTQKVLQNQRKKIGAFEVLNFLRAKKCLIWFFFAFSFSIIFELCAQKMCWEKQRDKQILWCATSNSNLENRVEFYFFARVLLLFYVGHARKSARRPLSVASQCGSRWGVSSFAPHPKCPFLSLHFLSIRLLQLVCAVALPAEHPHAHTQTSTHAAAADTQRRIHTDIFIGGSAKAEHVMKIMAKAEHTIKQPAREKLTNNVDPQPSLLLPPPSPPLLPSPSLSLANPTAAALCCCCRHPAAVAATATVVAAAAAAVRRPAQKIGWKRVKEWTKQQNGRDNDERNRRTKRARQVAWRRYTYIHTCVCVWVRTDVATARAARRQGEWGESKGARRDGATGSHCLSLCPVGLRIRRWSTARRLQWWKRGTVGEQGMGKGGQLGERGRERARERETKKTLAHIDREWVKIFCLMQRGDKWACLLLLLLLLPLQVGAARCKETAFTIVYLFW